MNMNYNYITKIFRSILTQIYVLPVLFTIFHFDREKLISKNCKYITRSLYIFGVNTSKYCSRIFYSCSVNWIFSKVHPTCHNIANGTKPGSDSQMTDKHAADCSKAVCRGVIDLCEMYKLFKKQCGQRYPSP